MFFLPRILSQSPAFKLEKHEYASIRGSDIHGPTLEMILLQCSSLVITHRVIWLKPTAVWGAAE